MELGWTPLMAAESGLPKTACSRYNVRFLLLTIARPADGMPFCELSLHTAVASLLDRMGQLVGQQFIALAGVWLELVFAEEDVLTVGESCGVDVASCRRGLCSGVHAHAAKIRAERLLHRAASDRDPAADRHPTATRL